MTVDTANLYAEFGVLVRKNRLRRGLRQEDLARSMKLSRSSIANIELGRQKVLLHQLYSLAGEFGISPARLLPRARSLNVDDFERRLPKHLPGEIKDEMRRIVASQSDREK